MSDLIPMLEAATEGSRELDAMIALEIGDYSMWKSKHGYWNIDGPNGERLTCEGRDPSTKFDPYTGALLPEEIPPMDWIWDATFKNVTTDINDIVSLIGRKLPGEQNRLVHEAWSSLGKKHSLHARTWKNDTDGNYGRALALALCIAFLRARQPKDGQ